MKIRRGFQSAFNSMVSKLQTLANQRLPNYNINMISSIGSFFSQHRPLDILWGRLDYTLTPQSKFLKLNKLIQEKPLCSRHLSISDTILRCSILQRGFTVIQSCVRAQNLKITSSIPLDNRLGLKTQSLQEALHNPQVKTQAKGSYQYGVSEADLSKKPKVGLGPTK